MRNLLRRLLPLLHVVGGFFMLWKGFSVLADSPCPAHVVISESMAPAFQRGDIILLSNRGREIRVGDIPVVWFRNAPLPMVHRATKILWAARPGGKGEIEQLILTKGDNNELDDVALYPGSRRYVYRDEIIGVVRGYLPFLGWITILLNETPYLKVGLVAGLTLISIFA
ncbi:putative signal peptidase I [Durotheca rogersii]|uniref:putative signal peptidase I n=1 Tax=Durotheca rogersii TaxID=419775 RepID=UPI00221F9B7F|nr:putative signal peptidase I [Durotheca rogersii]KAI5859416.1 putative signal peptidase I [Durotheca rogersii]